MRIVHRDTGEVIAQGERGWAITPLEGNYYISTNALVTGGFRVNYLPGLCFYKFLYVWVDFHREDGLVDRSLGWKYWLPNPLLPFIWFRIAVPGKHPRIQVIS